MRTHRPVARSCPHSSATGMKRPGISTRRQDDATEPEPPRQQAARSEIHNRLVFEKKLLLIERPAISDSSRSRSCNTSCICGSNTA